MEDLIINFFVLCAGVLAGFLIGTARSEDKDKGHESRGLEG